MTRDELIRYVAERYSTDAEYPWDDENFIFRHRGNRKWFAVAMRVPYERLRIRREGLVDIVDVKCGPLLMDAYRKQPGILPGYHMNKDHWLTILLDGSAEDGLIRELLEISYDLTNTTKKKTGAKRAMETYRYITLRERPELKDDAARWFHSKWGVPAEAYLACMDEYLSGETEYGWYLCLDGERIVGGLGVIENDFHDRKDLSPNVCAVYTEEEYRKLGVAGRLLNMVVEDLRAKEITPLYLVTDHTGFYERYGWEFLCMAQGDGEPDLTRLYIHR